VKAASLAQLIFVALLANFGLSAYLILDKHYAGRTSIIGLLSNTFLCLGKVYGYRTCVHACDAPSLRMHAALTQPHVAGWRSRAATRTWRRACLSRKQKAQTRWSR
jgi:hypothetical protein